MQEMALLLLRRYLLRAWRCVECLLQYAGDSCQRGVGLQVNQQITHPLGVSEQLVTQQRRYQAEIRTIQGFEWYGRIRRGIAENRGNPRDTAIFVHSAQSQLNSPSQYVRRAEET